MPCIVKWRTGFKGVENYEPLTALLGTRLPRQLSQLGRRWFASLWEVFLSVLDRWSECSVPTWIHKFGMYCFGNRWLHRASAGHNDLNKLLVAKFINSYQSFSYQAACNMHLRLGAFYRGLANRETLTSMLCVFPAPVCVISWSTETISGGKTAVLKKSILHGLLVCA